MATLAGTPKPLRDVLHFANAQPTEQTWRRLTLGPDAEATYPSGSEPLDGPMMGVKSLAELSRELAEFRAFLLRWIGLGSAYSEDAPVLVRILNERAKPAFRGWQLAPTSEQLFESWNTQNQTFSEMLYFMLALALKEASFRRLHRCEACDRIFYNPSARNTKYCSATCRNRVTVQRFRARQAHPAARAIPRTRRATRSPTTKPRRHT